MKSYEIQKGFNQTQPIDAATKQVIDYKPWSGTALTLGILAGMVVLPIIVETASLINSKVKP